jgi:Asp-tRNA(Asn)/Glu-tRNA(Gln) amidotransferase A subunit family amidase
MSQREEVAPNSLSAHRAAAAIRGGRLSSVALVEACLGRIAAREPLVGAWSFLDADYARQQAVQADERQRAGALLGPLHGVPVGVKDVFDTCDMPSEYGSASLQGRRPAFDADAVATLRAAGAVIMGKTVTTEFGMYADTSCRNPRDLERSPGVSSAGSAAAVADEMVPLALGTQHTASTLLPASCCGVYGFKPTFGFTSMRGSNILVPRLVNIGFLAREIEDIALFASVFSDDIRPSTPPLQPRRLAWLRGPGWGGVAADAKSALAAWLTTLPLAVDELALPASFERASEVAHALLSAHLAYRFGSGPMAGREGYCAPLLEAIAKGAALDAVTFIGCENIADGLAVAADQLFEACDAFVTLAAPGEALLRSAGPGSGAMTIPWSLAGLPTIALPLLKGGNGLPIGVQLVGPRGQDRRLLSMAAWMSNICNPSPPEAS